MRKRAQVTGQGGQGHTIFKDGVKLFKRSMKFRCNPPLFTRVIRESPWGRLTLYSAMVNPRHRGCREGANTVPWRTLTKSEGRYRRKTYNTFINLTTSHKMSGEIRRDAFEKMVFSDIMFAILG